ncbi:hypothetical protein DV38_01270 [Leptospira interrogans]|nr:hypothetical protein DV38_01270 [Leptospira interrogans]
MISRESFYIFFDELQLCVSSHKFRVFTVKSRACSSSHKTVSSPTRMICKFLNRFFYKETSKNSYILSFTNLYKIKYRKILFQNTVSVQNIRTL